MTSRSARKSPILRGLATGATLLLALPACTSTQDVLEPSAIAAQTPGTALPASDTDTASVSPAAPANTPAPATSGQKLAVPANAHIQFAPIVGTTVEAATPLTERLASRARERGIKLAGSTDPATTHVLKGYFSALTEGKETTVVYVWDVYDPAGTRLHRINGQQKVPITDGDGWTSVPPSAMQTIADTTVDQLAAWLSSSG
ncbi:hypothetical protein EET67_20725 [Pseudaminobacter arsenicus]|uniref:Lipoprotein n=1 Tax=Borborobacter arsenicus TaxID=1851146 RepID=A0A432V177_9HYPH|nr:hypothetical protein [Pseudaminobacter arsenicus]RUM95947.1 hypothetical protein EET67_20725 [Pseudaminobacter arsenicus]